MGDGPTAGGLLMPALIRTLDWDSDKVRCSTCGFPWAEHPTVTRGGTDHFCIVVPNVRAVRWVKEEIRP